MSETKTMQLFIFPNVLKSKHWKMKTLIKRTIAFCAFIAACNLLIAQNTGLETKIEKEEISQFIGNWKGQLTYLDYSSGTPYSMPCELSISRKGQANKLSLAYAFPNEPKANNTEKIKISKDGKYIDKNKITQKSKTAEDQIKFISESRGKDGNDNKPATIRYIYVIGDNDLVIRKEVKFDDSNEWIMRNEFSFNKV